MDRRIPNSGRTYSERFRFQPYLWNVFQRFGPRLYSEGWVLLKLKHWLRSFARPSPKFYKGWKVWNLASTSVASQRRHCWPGHGQTSSVNLTLYRKSENPMLLLPTAGSGGIKIIQIHYAKWLTTSYRCYDLNATQFL